MPNSATKVLIVGGGLGGLVLAILLQRAGIDYLVLEQSVIIRPIGSIIVLSSLILPLMEQLGLLEEIEQLAIPFGGMTVMRDDLSVVGRVVCNNSKGVDQKERYGHYDQCIPRPQLYNILLSRIPKDRIKLGKRLVNFQHISNNNDNIKNSNNNNKNGNNTNKNSNSNNNNNSSSSNSTSKPEQSSDRIMVRCSDGTFYYAEVLVGADGASSAVRQSLYRQMKEEGTLPKLDQDEQQCKQVSLLGVTNPLSTRKHPDLKSKFSNFKVVLSRSSPHMCWFMPIPGNRYSWLVTKTLDVPLSNSNNSNSDYSEWGPDATEEMSKAVRHLKGPDGGTVGDLIDSTNRNLISKVMLEERVFKTWYGGRTVLIGDACHKSVPFTGKGASESMLDAVVLASLLYDMPLTPSATSTTSLTSSSTSFSSTPPPSLSFQNLEALQSVFRQYYQIRGPIAKQAVDMSSQFGSILVRTGWSGELSRKLVFGLHTTRLGRVNMDKVHYHRIQASFLPPAPDHGSAPAKPHVVSRNPVIITERTSVVSYGTGSNERRAEDGHDPYHCGHLHRGGEYHSKAGQDYEPDHARVDEVLMSQVQLHTQPM
ncbi:hypothetical protein EDD11_001753 [Mortierella claussenii]|nr:hypothetical protein EDD11_001753 [Mortierella claussenii]